MSAACSRACGSRLLAPFLPIASFPFFAGCFTSLETAKTVDGASLTAGVQRYTVEETECVDGDCRATKASHHFVVLMPRFGVAATERQIGLDFGLRFLTDWLDHPDRSAGWLWTLEPKLQIPKNRVADVAVGAEFFTLYPQSVSLFLSRDLRARVPDATPYARLTFLSAFWNLLHGERGDLEGVATRVTFGVAFTLHARLRTYVEVERYADTDIDGDIRAAAGVEFAITPLREVGPGAPPR
jgi:hypothetical protein